MTKHTGRTSSHMTMTTMRPKYKVVWFYDLEGVERSYRFKADEASQRTEKLLKQGFKLKCDPFKREPLERAYD